MSLTKVTYSMIDGPVANVVDFGADPTGVTDSYPAVLAAYNSNAPIIQFPAGTFKMSQTLYINRGILINGSGAEDGTGNNGQSAGVASTVLSYIGTGHCIDVVGSFTEGISNVHLSNFMINGNVTADGGIYLGSGVTTTKCTYKNLGIFSFTNPAANKGYGVGIGNCLESIFENVYVWGCHDGFNIGFGACTTLEFRSCYSRVNSQYGWNIRQGNGYSFYQCIAEGNLKTGLVLNPPNGKTLTQVSFYSWYSEANGLDADTYPGALIRTTGTGICQEIYFYSPIFYDNSTYDVSTGVWTIACIKLGVASLVKFINAGVSSLNSNFIECENLTSNCEWQTGENVSGVNVTGNGIQASRIRVSTTPLQTPTLSAFARVNVTDAFTTSFAIPVSIVGQLQVVGGTDGLFGGTALFLVSRSATGNAGVAAITTFVGDGSGYTLSYQLSGNNFQLKHNQAGQTIQADLFFMPTT
jgi:hypothetical protein